MGLILYIRNRIALKIVFNNNRKLNRVVINKFYYNLNQIKLIGVGKNQLLGIWGVVVLVLTRKKRLYLCNNSKMVGGCQRKLTIITVIIIC